MALLLLMIIASSCSKKTGEYPKKPIKVYVGFAPGGGTDLIARTVASLAPKYLDQRMVVINLPGASGTLAARTVANAKPDGYTLLIAGGSETVSVGHFKKLPYHPLNSFTPIIRMMRERVVLNVNGQSNWTQLDTFVADAKDNPGKYRYATAGHGSIFHSAMMAFCDRAAIQMKHIPYKGGAPSVAALMGEHVDIALAGPGESWLLHKAGKIRSLAITSLDRTELQPDVPTLKELGYDVYLENQKGFVAPAETPPERIWFLHDALKKVYDSEEFIELCQKQKIERGYLGPDDFRKSLQTMYEQIGKVIEKGQ